MKARFEFGNVKLDVSHFGEGPREAPAEDAPFRVLLLGDFSGRDGRAKPAGIGRPRRVDRDSFDDVLRKCGTELQIPLGGGSISLWFNEIDDFEPGRLYRRVPLFEKLRQLRERLLDPATFREAAGDLSAPAEPAAGPLPPAPDTARMASRSLLDEAVTSTESRGGTASGSAPDELRAFLDRAVAPHLVPREDPKQAELVALVDQAASAQMRALLHLPAYQALEAAWRGLLFTVRRISDDSRVKLEILDISKRALAEDLLPAARLETTATYEALTGPAETPGAEPWAVIGGNYFFDSTETDLILLHRLAVLARAAGAPFIAGVRPSLLGCADVSALPDPEKWTSDEDPEMRAAWDRLRELPEARYLGLALPRFLLRLPYGKETQEAEAFDFEEVAAGFGHEDYLWGNSVFLCISLLAESFVEAGWRMRLAKFLEVGGLPLHVTKVDGEAAVKPVAEVQMTEDVALRILDAGLMPVVSLKDRDTVRLVRFQSIASPAKALAGRWG